jgi:hypothetical protein
MDTTQRLAANGKVGWSGCLVLTLGLALLLSACAPGGSPDQELRQEIKGLKGEVKSLQEQLARLEAGQQAILALLPKSGAAPAAAPAPAPVTPAPPEPAPASPPLTVSQLLAAQDRYLGTRVTVKGMVGTVLMHHKSFILNSPQGMVEVFFDKLPDAKQVQRLSSTNLDQPVTVTGMVSLPAKSGMRLQIQAEAVEF